jgi:hypothetical protein
MNRASAPGHSITHEQMKKRIVQIVAILPALLLAYICSGCYMILDLPAHQGDGEFENIARRHGPFVINGYRINFERIDLSKDYEAKMTFSRLPRFGSKCSLYFVIEDPDHRLESGGMGRHAFWRGKVAIEVCDSRGTVVAHVKGRLSELVWSGPWGRHALYPPSMPFPHQFQPDSTESYTLTISYTGDPGLATFQGCASIQCGGTK